jgi:hypothetical protein
MLLQNPEIHSNVGELLKHSISSEKTKGGLGLPQDCIFTKTWDSAIDDYVLSLAILTAANSISVGPRLCTLSSISGPVHTNARPPSEFQVAISLNCSWKQF